MPSWLSLGAIIPLSVVVTSLVTNTSSKTSSVGLGDITKTDTSTCADSVGQMTSSAQYWYYILVSSMEPDTRIRQF
jgi:hypothetical protein